MKKNKIIKLAIGDVLFRYVSLKGVFSYKVIGVRDYKDSVLYEVECQDCRDHDNCRLLISQVDNLPCFAYVSMVDEDEENEQYFWHTETHYFMTKNACLRDAYKRSIAEKEEAIKKMKEELKKAEDRLTEFKILEEGYK